MSLCGKTSCYDHPCAPCAVINDALLSRGVTVDEDLDTALSHHPQPWGFLDLAEVALAIDNGSDEPNFTWVVRLIDGRWAAVRGWHDYTGWDCQSGLKTEWYATKDDAFRTLVDWERAAAGMAS